jgi:hypothetical protein
MNSSCECSGILKYDERYDSLYCEKCNEWMEQKCTDETCFYCRKRPERPIDINLKEIHDDFSG